MAGRDHAPKLHMTLGVCTGRCRVSGCSVLLAVDPNRQRSMAVYERLLMDVVKGNLRLFMRCDELDVAWRWIDPIRVSWLKYEEPLKTYTAGSWGPSASSALISREGLAWSDEL